MERPVGAKTILDYVQDFLAGSRAIGVVLFCCTLLSLFITNSTVGPYYIQFLLKHLPALEALHLPHSVKHWINDGFMAIFFFLVGMEIKRELLIGELSSLKKAVLPIGAAIGGMVVPAFIFVIFNRGTEYQNGWGIAMATDIAFSLGVASLLGSRFPVNLKIFLMALAIIDDLGAILVLAFFYGEPIKGWWLVAAGGILLLLFLMNYKKLRFGVWHIILGVALWYCMNNSGIHATIAGVLFAFMIPGKELKSLEYIIHKPVNFIILPLFALANTAIVLKAGVFSELGTTLTAGILLGLFVGKPVGVMLASWLLVKRRFAKLPKNVSWMQLAGAGILAGIGFSMSIFMAALAYENEVIQDSSKIAVLIGMVLSVAAGTLWMRLVSKPAVDEDKKPLMAAQEE